MTKGYRRDIERFDLAAEHAKAKAERAARWGRLQAHVHWGTEPEPQEFHEDEVQRIARGMLSRRGQ